MSVFSDIRDSITGHKRGSGTDIKAIIRGSGAVAAATSKGGKNFLTGKKGKFNTYNVDPNFNTYQEGLARTTRALEDPSMNPMFQAAMKRAGKFHPGGGRDRAFAMASLAGLGASNAAYGAAYDRAAPIVEYQGATSGALPYLTDAYARYAGAKEGAKSQGVKTQGGGADLNSILPQLLQLLQGGDVDLGEDAFRQPNRPNESAEGEFGY